MRAPLERLHALPEAAPAGAAAAAAPPLPPQSARDFVPASDARYRQHRCFPRLRDATQATTDLALPLGAFGVRLLALWRCLEAAEGAEPAEPPLLKPADDYKLRYRPGRGAPPPQPQAALQPHAAPQPAPATAPTSATGEGGVR